MKLLFLAFALLFQRGAANPPKAAPTGSIAGTVVHRGTGAPLSSVTVTLAKIAPSTDNAATFRSLVRNTGADSSQAERGLSGELLQLIMAEVGFELGSTRPGQRGEPTVSPLAVFAKSFAFEDIHTMMVDSTGRLATVSRSAPPLTTDSTGKFSFQNLEPGAYRLIFSGNGFVRQDYSQYGSTGGSPLLLEAGKNIDGLVARLTPTGVITGRVMSSAGPPLGFVNVRLSQIAYDLIGRRNLTPVDSVRTNDRGEYRLPFLAPGRYVVSAGISDRYVISAEQSRLGTPTTQNRIADQRYAVSYYPGAIDSNAAMPIELKAGGIVADINFVLAAQGSRKVRGRILDSGGARPQQATIRMIADGGSTLQGAFNGADGTFEIRDVPDGAYMLTFDTQTLNNSRPASERLRGSAPVTVSGADVEGVTVPITGPSLLNGRVRTDNTSPGESTLPAGLTVEFRIIDTDGSQLRPNVNTPQSRAVAGDGTFQISRVYPGEYWMLVRGLPPGFYVKSARLGEIEVFGRLTALPAKDPNTILDIVISSKAAAIDGMARTADGRPAAGALVVLIPDRNRDRPGLFRPVNADTAGNFSFADVEPGDYHVAVWTFLEPNAYFDPEMIRLALEKGRALHVVESSKQTVSVDALPLAEAP